MLIDYQERYKNNRTSDIRKILEFMAADDDEDYNDWGIGDYGNSGGKSPTGKSLSGVATMLFGENNYRNMLYAKKILQSMRKFSDGAMSFNDRTKKCEIRGNTKDNREMIVSRMCGGLLQDKIFYKGVEIGYIEIKEPFTIWLRMPITGLNAPWCMGLITKKGELLRVLDTKMGRGVLVVRDPGEIAKKFENINEARKFVKMKIGKMISKIYIEGITKINLYDDDLMDRDRL